MDLIEQVVLRDCKIGYAFTDEHLRVLEVRGAEEVLGYNPEGDDPVSLLALVPELVGSEGALQKILTGQLPRFHLALINREQANGTTIYLDMTTLPYRDANGRIQGLIHIVHDVTERGRLEQMLMQQRNELDLLHNRLAQHNLTLETVNQELQHLNALKSVFISVAAHELLTPLASISGFVELLLDGAAGPLTETQLEYLNIVQSSTARLLKMTDQLLDATRLELGRMDLVLQPADLVRLVAEIADEFKPALAEREQHLELTVQTGLPLALCDLTRAGQIIRNLLSNATKYTPEGGKITIRIQMAEEGFLQVTMADNGVGIAPEDRAGLFDLFTRAKSPHQVHAVGTGLGLYITRALVELHGGRIWFESVPGEGSSFHVTFPVVGMVGEEQKGVGDGTQKDPGH